MANEQTSVPLYAAAEVLTAANMNISAGTGVPVFATTVTRDAAFGGAGEKVLAEGQLCYLSASNIVQYYDGAAWATVGPTSSKIAQVVSVLMTASFSTSSTSLIDITGLSVSITPTLNTSKVLVFYSASGTSSDDANSGNNGVVLVRNSTSLAVSTAGSTQNLTGVLTQRLVPATEDNKNVAGSFLDSPATTSATTYKLQGKCGGGTLYINRSTSAITGSVSTLTVMEVLA
jgi:hypothetical protein